MLGTMLLVFAALAAVGDGAAGDFKIVISSSNPVDSLKKEDVARLFLRKVTSWKDGREVLPVDQSLASSVRHAFSRDVLRLNRSAIEEYWQRQVFTGRAAPPPVKVTDEDVVGFVSKNDGAIGYVSGSAELRGVKALKVVD